MLWLCVMRDMLFLIMSCLCASLNEAGYLVYFRLEVRKSFNFKLSYVWVMYADLLNLFSFVCRKTTLYCGVFSYAWIHASPPLSLADEHKSCYSNPAALPTFIISKSHFTESNNMLRNCWTLTRERERERERLYLHETNGCSTSFVNSYRLILAKGNINVD
jgi:hypothetical protein